MKGRKPLGQLLSKYKHRHFRALLSKSVSCGEKAKNVADATFIDFDFFFFLCFFSRTYCLQSQVHDWSYHLDSAFVFRFLNPFSPRTLSLCRNQNVSIASKTPSICTCAAAPQEQKTGAFLFSKLSFFLSVLDFILFLCFYLILFVKFTKLKSPAMQILQSFKLVTYFQRFVINSPQNTDKFRAEKIEAFIFGMESEKNSK